MTAAAAAVAVRLRAGAAAGISADACAVGVLSSFGALLALLTWGTWGDIASDTGYDLLAGARLAGGELPYFDFVYYYGPLAPAALGLAALVGGSGLAPALAVGLAIASAIVAATYALARLLTGPVGAFLAAAITAGVAFEPTNFSFVLPHTYSATLALLFTLGFLLALGHGRLGAAGAAAGLVALTRPEFAIAVAVAAIVWLAARRRAGALDRSELVRLVGPALALPLAVYGVLLVLVGPRRLLFENLYPVEELRAGGNALLSAYAPLTAGSFADVGLKLLAYAAGTAALLVLARGIDRAGRSVGIGVAVAAAAAAGAAALARPEVLREGLYLVFGWIPAGAVAALAFLALRTWRRRESSQVAHLELALLAVLAVLATKTYAGFLFHAAPHEQLAAYAAPFAALFLVRLHIGWAPRGAVVAGAAWLAFVAAAGALLTINDARAESATVRGDYGTLRATPAEAATYSAALEWIGAATRPNDPILIAPQLTTLYTLSGRESPLDRLSLLPGALIDAQAERDAIAQLEKADVRLAVIDARAFSEYGGHTSFGRSFDRLLARWLEDRFVRARTYRSGQPQPRPVEIWVRRKA